MVIRKFAVSAIILMLTLGIFCPFKVNVMPVEQSTLASARLDLDTSVENFLKYSEIDPSNNFTVTSTRVTGTDVTRNQIAYVIDDKGSNFFNGDFEHLCAVNTTDNFENGGYLGLWGVSNAVHDYLDADNNDHVLIFVERAAAGTARYWLREAYDDNRYQDYWTGTWQKQYWVNINRSGTTINASFYSDSSRQNLVGNITLTLQSAVSYRYIYAGMKANGVGTPKISGYIEDLDLQTTFDEPSVGKVFNIAVLQNSTNNVNATSAVKFYLWHLRRLIPINYTIVSVGSLDLDSYGTLILPDLTTMSVANTSYINRWVDKGGRLICIDQSGRYVAKNSSIERSEHPFQTALGISLDSWTRTGANIGFYNMTQDFFYWTTDYYTTTVPLYTVVSPSTTPDVSISYGTQIAQVLDQNSANPSAGIVYNTPANVSMLFAGFDLAGRWTNEITFFSPDDTSDAGEPVQNLYIYMLYCGILKVLGTTPYVIALPLPWNLTAATSFQFHVEGISVGAGQKGDDCDDLTYANLLDWETDVFNEYPETKGMWHFATILNRIYNVTTETYTSNATNLLNLMDEWGDFGFHTYDHSKVWTTEYSNSNKTLVDISREGVHFVSPYWTMLGETYSDYNSFGNITTGSRSIAGYATPRERRNIPAIPWAKIDTDWNFHFFESCNYIHPETTPDFNSSLAKMRQAKEWGLNGYYVVFNHDWNLDEQNHTNIWLETVTANETYWLVGVVEFGDWWTTRWASNVTNISSTSNSVTFTINTTKNINGLTIVLKNVNLPIKAIAVDGSTTACFWDNRTLVIPSLTSGNHTIVVSLGTTNDYPHLMMYSGRDLNKTAKFTEVQWYSVSKTLNLTSIIESDTLTLYVNCTTEGNPTYIKYGNGTEIIGTYTAGNTTVKFNVQPDGQKQVTINWQPETQDNTVVLNAPSDSAQLNELKVSFNYMAIFYQGSLVNSSLWLNVSGTWQRVAWNSTGIQNATMHTINYTFSAEGTYVWNVQVYNSTHEHFATTNFTLTITRARAYVTIKPNNQEGILYGVNVTAFNGSNVITSCISNISGTLKLANLPYGNVIFVAYAKSDYSQVIGNVTVFISSEDQSFDLICDQNYDEVSNSWEIIIALSLSMSIVALPLSMFSSRVRIKKRYGNSRPWPLKGSW